MTQDDHKYEDGTDESSQSSEELLPWSQEDDAYTSDYDPELAELGGARANDSILRPILMMGVLIMGGYILSDWQEEVRYFFSPSEPVMVGNVTEFPEKRNETKGWSPKLEHNRYVKLTGIPSKRSMNRRYRYFKLIGGQVYVEEAREDADKGEMERIIDEGKIKKGQADRNIFIGEGRAVSLAMAPNRYSMLRDYYGRSYGLDFCVGLTMEERASKAKKQRELIKKNWAKRWESASAQERIKDELGPKPTDAQLEGLMENNPVCVDAWLIQVGKPPSAHWWYIALSALFLIFMMVDFVFLIRWFSRFFRPDDDL